MKTYEVFLKKEGKDPFIHAGSVDAPDDEMALTYAREAYGRRSEGDQMWVVLRCNVLIADEVELEMADRTHKHNDGKLVAELRRTTLSDQS
ncbi:MAG: 1,2-phenylacetyl-CoA epoxidase subunit B [Acidimicrobiaceae bacterium]|jgi:ring-1,2-phenylacetyl-CoA epoxidase subunit PaaB|nr:1,2-phenylacetyl-CoA epoxidase subunit B [Acidimicrobiaceae bacterium]|tara:strand:- start:3095 stop:3367 length:273 start_codon:yes stop_codon:yes gene_type:complete